MGVAFGDRGELHCSAMKISCLGGECFSVSFSLFSPLELASVVVVASSTSDDEKDRRRLLVGREVVSLLEECKERPPTTPSAEDGHSQYESYFVVATGGGTI